MTSSERTTQLAGEDEGRGANLKGKIIVRRKTRTPENSSEISLKTDIISYFIKLSANFTV